MDMSMQSRQQAWHRMFQTRTCPPLNVLRKGGAQVDKHLRTCRNCREDLEHFEVYSEAGKLLTGIPLSIPGATAPVPGDIRRVRPTNSPETFFDAEGRYHNPPLVLVLDEADELGFVRVAQIFDEADLCDEGDVPLENGDAGYAEAWNVYGLPVKALSPHLYHHVDDAYVTSVLEAEKKPLPSLDPVSALYFFRMCELETGSFFSLPINLEALSLLESEATEPVRTKAKITVLHTDTKRPSVLNRFLETIKTWDPQRYAKAGLVAGASLRGLHDLVRTTAAVAAPMLAGFAGATVLGKKRKVTLAAAAAANGNLGPDDGAERLTLPCLVQKGEGEPFSIPADVHIHRIESGFVATAYFSVPDGIEEALVHMTCKGKEPDNELTTKIEDNNIARVRAVFTGNDLKREDIEITLVAYTADEVGADD